MGFRNGTYAKVWDVKPVSNTITDLRISISRRLKGADGQYTDEYETDFSGFVSCVGTAVANKALSLKSGDRIKLGDVEVTQKYDKEKSVTYTRFRVFSFEAEGVSAPTSQPKTPEPAVDDGEVEDDNLPF